MLHTYKLGEFARLVSVHPKTVQRWDRTGLLPAHRTPGGHRFYTEEDLQRVFSPPRLSRLPFAERVSPESAAA